MRHRIYPCRWRRTQRPECNQPLLSGSQGLVGLAQSTEEGVAACWEFPSKTRINNTNKYYLRERRDCAGSGEANRIGSPGRRTH